jgi:NarL family two-component system response regulator YdfI
MIRIKIISEEMLPDSLKNLLAKSTEMKLVQEDPADVILFCCGSWNRAALMRLEGIPIPTAVVCEKAEEPFRTESVIDGKVSAILNMNVTEQQLIACLLAVAAGLKVLQHFPVTNHSAHTPVTLTPRELEILRLIADGEGNKSIAYLLEISPHTVKFHISSIFEKLHVLSRTEAIRAGIRSGLISI